MTTSSSLFLQVSPPNAGSLPLSDFGLTEDRTRVLMLSSCTHYSGVLQWDDMQVTRRT